MYINNYCQYVRLQITKKNILDFTDFSDVI